MGHFPTLRNGPCVIFLRHISFRAGRGGVIYQHYIGPDELTCSIFKVPLQTTPLEKVDAYCQTNELSIKVLGVSPGSTLRVCTNMYVQHVHLLSSVVERFTENIANVKALYSTGPY